MDTLCIFCNKKRPTKKQFLAGIFVYSGVVSFAAGGIGHLQDSRTFVRSAPPKFHFVPLGPLPLYLSGGGQAFRWSMPPAFASLTPVLQLYISSDCEP